MTPCPSHAIAAEAPLAILTAPALFERQCVISGVGPNERALRSMLNVFFEAGRQAGINEATRPVRRPANPDKLTHAAPDLAFAALGEIGFDPERVMATLGRTASNRESSAPDVDAFLREAVRLLIVVRGRLSTEINYKGVVEAYDAAVAVHGN